MFWSNGCDGKMGFTLGALGGTNRRGSSERCASLGDYPWQAEEDVNGSGPRPAGLNSGWLSQALLSAWFYLDMYLPYCLAMMHTPKVGMH